MAPLNGIPCVFHETIATEDVDNGTVRIKEGNTYVDFCIGDPASPNDFLYIPATTAKIVLIRADAVTTTTGHETFIDKPIPPNIQVFADRHNFPLTVPGAVFGHTLKHMTFTEQSLDVNEQITVMGIVTIGILNPPSLFDHTLMRIHTLSFLPQSSVFCPSHANTSFYTPHKVLDLVVYP